MLNKTHNSVVTLAILLTLAGVSKPARAFLLSQAENAPATFTLPDSLPQDAALNIATSNSTKSITKSLNQGFNEKYPNATVNVEQQSSDEALKSLASGKINMVAIGRDLTAAEKDRGFVSVPISREKIAIVVSDNNSYDGNLTIGEFAKIFRGEITDWSELGRDTPGEIKLVDLPDSNDTRRALPNYPVFQEAEFNTGSNATKLDLDNTEALTNALGSNAISYAVANDVRDLAGVKIVTMHQTQPSDPRYPFSQPFSLVYQGTPAGETEAYLGYATTEGGKQVTDSRLGSLPLVAAAVGSASGLQNSGNPDVKAASGTATSVADKPKSNGNAVNADGKSNVNGIESNTAANDADKSDLEGEDAKAKADINADGKKTDATKSALVANADADVDTSATDSGQPNPGVEGSGELNPDVKGSGELNPDVDGSGKVNPEVEGSGELNPDVEGSGELNPDVEGSGDRLSADNNVDDSGAEATAKKGKWWWWLPLILAVPLLGALFALGGRKRSDREPAIDNIPGGDRPDSGLGVSVTPDGGGTPPVGANVSGNLNNVADTAVNTTSRVNNSTLAAGGATIAAGSAAAANFVGRKRNIGDEPEFDPDIELDRVDTVDEIPLNPVSEFTTQETSLQAGDQSTRLQDGEDYDNIDNIGSGAAEFRTDADPDLNVGSDLDSDRSIVDPTVGNRIEYDSDVSKIDTRSSVADVDSLGGERDYDGREFRGDFVLQEETKDIDLTTGSDFDPSADSTITSEDTDLETATFDSTTADTDLDSDTDTNVIDLRNQSAGTAIAGGAAALGGAAAASRLFNRDTDSPVEDTTINTPEINTPDKNSFTSDFVESDLTEDTTSLETPSVDFGSTESIEPDSTSTEMDTEINPPGIRDSFTSDADSGTTVIEPVGKEFTPEGSTENLGSNIGDRTTQAGESATSAFFDRDTHSPVEDTAINTSEWSAPTADVNTEINAPSARDNIASEYVESELTEDTTSFEAPSVDFDSTGSVEPDATSTEMDTEIDPPGIGDSITGEFVDGETTIVEPVDAEFATEDISSGFGNNFSDRTTQAGGAAIGGAAASGLFNRDTETETEQTTDLQGANDYDLSQGTSDRFNLDANDANLDEITLDDAARAEDLRLDEITFDDTEATIDASLDEITLDDAARAEDLSLDEITFDNTRGNLDASLDEITLDDAARAEDLGLNEITFDDTESNLDASLEDITFDRVENINISLDDLGFEDADIDTSSQLPRNRRVDNTDLADERSDDMNNISEWLDSLQPQKKETDNITEWLDTLDSENVNEPNSSFDTKTDKTDSVDEDSDDISFQFLEDLLDRDPKDKGDNR